MKDEIKEINLSEMLFNRDERLLDYITNLQQRIDKAIKYIEQEVVFYDSYDGEDTMLEDLCERYYKNLLNILNGDDDNE